MTQRLSGQQRTAAYLGGVVVLMASLSFAAVPFYDWFCRVTGFGGTTGVAESAPDTILDQTVVVKFDASIERGMPWQFRPVQREMTVRIGENALAFYEAYNPTDRVVAGTASFNVAPEAAGGYFDKIACFCFTEQVLQPGERVEMPVSFFVDPEMVKDPEGQFVKEITLSYTFYEIDLPEEQAALAAPAGEAVN
ncbi:cytochrome c oxidase assembly protein [Paragemmobacter ruber]|uniref:Cytochrome c oxidase assembly protein CtaG n=1 Tax=Paragemmobacter ruber TaxID=1985673 RepID=A0ABW9Y0Y6_9RHOB|nr:cytochrome c oxidase assembly protein [Rhodobacter ruber]NBE06166.1 cytochrome c oxidase assembly protein [Rhodobacter ruber]